MATQRYISTSFWDDEWVQTHDPSEKLFYLYLLTNPLTNIAGVYKITDRRISFDTGFNDDVVKEMWRRFGEAGKVFRRGEWLVIPSWPRHQRVTERSNCRKGIDRVLLALPDDIWTLVNQVGYQYRFMKPLARSFKPLEGPSIPLNYSDLDSDSDSDPDAAPPRVPADGQEVSPRRELENSPLVDNSVDNFDDEWEDDEFSGDTSGPVGSGPADPFGELKDRIGGKG